MLPKSYQRRCLSTRSPKTTSFDIITIDAHSTLLENQTFLSIFLFSDDTRARISSEAKFSRQTFCTRRSTGLSRHFSVSLFLSPSGISLFFSSLNFALSLLFTMTVLTTLDKRHFVTHYVLPLVMPEFFFSFFFSFILLDDFCGINSKQIS